LVRASAQGFTPSSLTKTPKTQRVLSETGHHI
jgi:hypothetical protein